MVYELSERRGCYDIYLCHRVNGFNRMWWDFITYTEIPWVMALSPSLESALELLHPDVCNFQVASAIREEVRNLLPCSMTVEEFSDIVNKHLRSDDERGV